MKKLILIIACLSLLAATGLAQRGTTPESPQTPGVLTAPGAQVVIVRPPGDGEGSAPAAAPCAQSAPVRIALVIKGVANLRDQANVAGAVVAEVKEGSALVIEGEDGPGSPWYRVTDVRTGRQGWVHGNVIKITYSH